MFLVSLAHQIVAIRLDKMERKDPKEEKKHDDDDYAAMNEMMKLDDIQDRAKVSIRVKNGALAKVVRLQVMMMRYNRSKQGASASKQDDMHMANLIKQEEHEKRMRTVRSKGNV